jgi:hypothetical protein
MLNPNICKRVMVDVSKAIVSKYGSISQFAEYKGYLIEISEYTEIEPGKRRLYLKYSIMNDRYYLTKRV